MALSDLARAVSEAKSLDDLHEHLSVAVYEAGLPLSPLGELIEAIAAALDRLAPAVRPFTAADSKRMDAYWARKDAGDFGGAEPDSEMPF
jgi:hypothetical protein